MRTEARTREGARGARPPTALRAIALLAAGAASVSLANAADPAAGEAAFAPCAGCHAVGPGAEHRFGPHLNAVMTRGAGAAEGYEYSDALLGKVGGENWTEASLDAYLAAPMSFVPGTKMAYPGLEDGAKREAVIAWLESFDVDGASSATEEAANGAGAAARAAVSDTVVPETPRPLAKDVPLPEHGVLHLGRPALPEEVAAWDIDVRPDGAGLPEGEGDATRGGELYDARCAACHGVFGEGEGRWPVLAGGFGTLTEERPEKTIGSYWPYLSTVYDYVRRAMPFGNVRSLSDDDVYALTAYLLYLNDLVDENFTLSSASFAEVAMLPNAPNFEPDGRAGEAWFEAAAEPCMSDCTDGKAEVVMRARVLDVTPEGDEGDGGAGVD